MSECVYARVSHCVAARHRLHCTADTSRVRLFALAVGAYSPHVCMRSRETAVRTTVDERVADLEPE